MKKITNLLNVALLVVCTQFAFADAPDWQDDPGGYIYSATFSGALVINDGVQMGDCNELEFDEDGNGFCVDAADMFAAFDEAGNVRGKRKGRWRW